jgi:hypothetical protein
MFLKLGCAQAMLEPARKIVGLVECLQAGRAIPLAGTGRLKVSEEGSTAFR